MLAYLIPNRNSELLPKKILHFERAYAYHDVLKGGQNEQ